jgi:hypothetical protein
MRDAYGHQPLDEFADDSEPDIQMSLMGVCLYCHTLFRHDLSTAIDCLDFCCGSHQDFYLDEEGME